MAAAERSGGGVVKHLVIVQFKEDVTPERLDGLIRGYAGLVDKVPSMKAFHWDHCYYWWTCYGDVSSSLQCCYCHGSQFSCYSFRAKHGAAAPVLVSGEKVKNLGLQVLARTRAYADVAQAPELFTEGGDPAFFTSRGSVFLGFVRATRRDPAFTSHATRVIDADYRGPEGVVLFNHSEADFAVNPGDRIAQMIVQVIVTPEVTEVEDLDATVRGEGGFGSTGV